MLLNLEILVNNFCSGCAENIKDSLQSAGRSRAARWFLLESCWLVISKCAECWSRILCLPVECMHKPSEFHRHISFAVFVIVAIGTRYAIVIWRIFFRWRVCATCQLMVIQWLQFHGQIGYVLLQSIHIVLYYAAVAAFRLVLVRSVRLPVLPGQRQNGSIVAK